ncbi:MAG: type II toxin-antitoxin system VapC family toxin [Thermoleophilaceae bacterium]|nr:type II toxin-antitoxin system VapC family toxin [Thermoleophilaceae bacterium]
MIGIDTNVLLRLLLDDDPSQVRRAKQVAESAEAAGQPLFVNDVVLAETVWTLGSRYDATKPELIETLRSLLDNARLAFENRAVLSEAVTGYERSSADFADCLIVAKNAGAGCTHTATFDRALRAFEYTKIL